jgi:hypothetical protein
MPCLEAGTCPAKDLWGNDHQAVAVSKAVTASGRHQGGLMQAFSRHLPNLLTNLGREPYRGLAVRVSEVFLPG